VLRVGELLHVKPCKRTHELVLMLVVEAVEAVEAVVLMVLVNSGAATDDTRPPLAPTPDHLWF
jgi:hypothetical protein